MGHETPLFNMFDLINSDSLDTAELAKELMVWMGTDELKRFVKEHGYDELISV